MSQIKCLNCGSFKTASNGMISFIVGMLFIFPISIFWAVFFGVFGLALSFLIGAVLMILPVFRTKLLKGWMCMQCHYKWK